MPVSCLKGDTGKSHIKEIDITKVYGGGRSQIPIEVRKALAIKDGDKIRWVKIGERYAIEKLK